MRLLPTLGALLLFSAAPAAIPAHAQTFNGYPCTSDCSGHEAGYDWARDKGITSEFGCGGNSNSFIEGCRSYVEEQNGDQSQAFGSQGSGSDSSESDDDTNY